MPVFVPHAGCPHACSFCNQRAISGAVTPPTPEQAAAVFERARESLGEKTRDAELAFFGGSFTAIEEAYRTALLEAAQPFLRRGGFAGIRVSTRPDCVDDAVLHDLKRYGVTTVELGVQSMRGEVLGRNARGHTPEDVHRASARVRACGLRLCHQMMTGLYGDDDAGALYTAREIIAMRPDMVRVYPALVLHGTRLETLYRDGAYTPQTLEEAVVLGARLLELFGEAGIPVIRFGLHDEPGLDVVAGPHHPALRELCEARRMLERARRLLHGDKVPPGQAALRVHPRCVSQMAGQRRMNLKILAEQGYEVKIIADAAVPEHAVRLGRVK